MSWWGDRRALASGIALAAIAGLVASGGCAAPLSKPQVAWRSNGPVVATYQGDLPCVTAMVRSMFSKTICVCLPAFPTYWKIVR